MNIEIISYIAGIVYKIAECSLILTLLFFVGVLIIFGSYQVCSGNSSPDTVLFYKRYLIKITRWIVLSFLICVAIPSQKIIYSLMGQEPVIKIYDKGDS